MFPSYCKLVRLELSPDILPGTYLKRVNHRRPLLNSRHVTCEDPAAAKACFEGRGYRLNEEEGGLGILETSGYVVSHQRSE